MSELTREFRPQDITPDRKDFAFEANPAECRALAERFGIRAVHHLKVTGTLARVAGGDEIDLDGRISAEVEQDCSLTLEPVREAVDCSFSVRFSGEVDEDSPVGESEDLLAERSFEPMPSGPIDIGEIAAQYLSMGINPYPRAPGATLDTSGLEGVECLSEEEAHAARSPFAKLKKTEDRG